MISLLSVALALSGTMLASAGGFLVGRWWQRRRQQTWADETNLQVSRVLEQITDRLAVEDELARTVDPIAHGGRVALSEVLAGLRDYGGYESVVLADDAGLVIAACGGTEATELVAVEAAAYTSVSMRVPGERQTILQTQSERRWTLHRYFNVQGAQLSLSASRRGGTPRADALDGALGAIQRVLADADDVAA